MKKIVFFGTSNFSREILKTLKQHFEVLAVVTQPDRPVGRKQEITESPVSKQARELNIPVLKPESLKDDSSLKELQVLPKADLLIVVAYGQIIPKAVLDLAPAINIHGSILPKYRGASPIHSSLLSGETETGISIMLMDEKMDHGPVLKIEKVKIEPEDTFIELEQKLCELAKTLIIPTANDFLEGRIQPQEQDHSKATFCKTISKEDGRIDWNTNVAEVFNKYRAYIQWPGVWTTFEGKILKIKKCLPNTIKTTAGVVSLNGEKILVGCLDASLELLEVQLEGKNPTTASDFLRGHPNFVNTKL